MAESCPGEGWGTSDFVPLEDTAGVKSTSSHSWGDETKEESTNRMQVSYLTLPTYHIYPNICGATQNFREFARNNMNTYFKS